ncbi:hypothetical protein [Acinetobacter sp. ANC 4193]
MTNLTQQISTGNSSALNSFCESVLEKPTIQCNWCNQLFTEKQLAKDLFDEETGEYFDGCPDCKTDQHLTDLLPSPNLIDQFIASGEFDQALLEAITDLVEGKNA